VDDPATSEWVVQVRAELRAMLAGAEDEHRMFQTAARAAVVEERRATEDMYQMEPLYFERTGFPRGRLLADGETAPREYRHGFDSQGRLRTIDAFFRGTHAHSFYFAYEPGRIVERRWFAGARPPRVACVFLLDDAGRCHTHVGMNSSGELTADVYEYDGPRVTRFARYNARGPASLGSTLWFEVTWNARGRVERIGAEGRPDASPLYQAPKRRLKTVLADAQRLLIERIPARLTGLTVPDRVYGLALNFNDSDRHERMPPVLGLLLESNRSAQLGRAEKPDLDEVWNPGLEVASPTPQEFRSPDLDDEELMALGTEVAMLAQTDDDIDALVKCHIRVAKALNRLDWRQIMPVTDDFIVFPVDYEACRYLDLIEASVPATRVRRLRAAGLLPEPGQAT
jgi:hypothetical protein